VTAGPVPREDELAVRLAGLGGRDGLAALVDGDGAGAAVVAVAGFPAGDSPAAHPVTAHRVTWKPDRRLRAFYDVPTPDGPRPVGVRWDVRSGRVVEAWPADAAWPHLAEAVSEATVAEVLRAAGCDGDGGVGLEVLRYRPGQRHVVRLRCGATEVYLKVGPAGGASAAAARSAALAGAARLAGAVVTEPVWWSDRLGAVAMSAVPGRVRTVFGPAPAVGAGDANGSGGPEHLERMAEFLRALHDGAVPDGVPDAPGPAEEAALTERAWEHAVRLHPTLCPALRRVLDDAVRAIGPDGADGFRSGIGGPSRARSLLHGDVKVEHLLDTGDGLAVIDLDSAVLGSRLRDLGRLLASLWWLEPDSATDGLREPGAAAHDPAVRRSLLAAYDPDGALDRVPLGGWTALALLKQAARRVPVLAPDLDERLQRWLDRARTAAAGDVA